MYGSNRVFSECDIYSSSMFRKLLLMLLLGASAFATGKTSTEQISALAAQIDQADQMIVYSEGFRREFVIYRSANRRDFDDLKTAITLRDEGGPGMCACIDGPEIALLKDGNEIAAVWNHEGTAIGSSVWEGEWETNDSDRWLHWFDARGIKSPRQSYEERLAQQKQEVENEKRWMAAMPSSIRPLWNDVRKQLYDPPIKDEALKPLNKALVRQFPDQNDRIRALFSWFGSGAGPWSGVPVDEEVAERLLLQYSTNALISGAETAALNEQQLEGAARIFGSWSLEHERPGERSLLPSDLKRTLLEHCLKSTDQDKVERAKAAFGDN